MKLHNKKVAFSLIELLVVITIMWILAVWGTTVYNSQIQKARDSNRITDVTNLQSAIEQFYQDKASYPKWGKDWINPDSFSIISIMPNLVMDPKFNEPCAWKWNQTSVCWYIYTVDKSASWIANWAYEVSTAFENDWNLESRAANVKDWWNDDLRLELWLWIDTLNTTATSWVNLTSAWKQWVNDTAQSIVISRIEENQKMVPVVYSRTN